MNARVVVAIPMGTASLGLSVHRPLQTVSKAGKAVHRVLSVNLMWHWMTLKACCLHALLWTKAAFYQGLLRKSVSHSLILGIQNSPRRFVVADGPHIVFGMRMTNAAHQLVSYPLFCCSAVQMQSRRRLSRQPAILRSSAVKN